MNIFILTALVALAGECTLAQDYAASLRLLPQNPPAALRQQVQFLKACNHFALNQKELALQSIKVLNDSFDKLERRQEVLVGLMEDELSSWKEGDLKDIGRDMAVSSADLENNRVGKVTQKTQQQIVDKLDKLIKEKEDAAKQSQLAASGDSKQGGQSQQGTPSSPANESEISRFDGKGEVDPKKLKGLERAWGGLPESERKRIVSELTRELPEKYKAEIESYYRSLNKQNGK